MSAVPIVAVMGLDYTRTRAVSAILSRFSSPFLQFAFVTSPLLLELLHVTVLMQS